MRETSKPANSNVPKLLSVAFLMALLLVGMAWVGAPQAHAATISETYPNCGVTYVQLHGEQAATVKCLQEQSTHSVQHPNISPVSCGATVNFIMKYNYGNNTICFAGTGYWSSGNSGVPGWYNVNYMAACNANGWVMAYQPGHKVYFGPNNTITTPYADVTQVDITSAGFGC